MNLRVMMLFIDVPTGIEVSARLGISGYMSGTACSYSFKRHEPASMYLPLVLCAGAAELSSNLWVLLLGNSSLHGKGAAPNRALLHSRSAALA